MGILADSSTRVLVQGITSPYGAAQTVQMQEYGTLVVAGVRPGRGGEKVLGVPVFDSVADAVAETGATTSVAYVGPRAAKNAVLEALDAGLRLVTLATEYVPIHDVMVMRACAERHDAWIIGPNTIGLITPRRRVMLGTLLPTPLFDGPVGIVSRSGTLAVAVTRLIGLANLGVSTSVAVGGDLVTGRNPADYLREFEKDPETDVLVFLGEIGGLKEYEAAEVIATMRKKVVAYVAGAAAPPGMKLGHAGAIVARERDSADAKRAALDQAGAVVVDVISQIPDAVKSLL